MLPVFMAEPLTSGCGPRSRLGHGSQAGRPISRRHLPLHHLINRGDRREPISHDNVDRQRFLQTLVEACAKTDWQVPTMLREIIWSSRLRGPIWSKVEAVRVE